MGRLVPGEEERLRGLRHAEGKMRVSCLGPAGSYSQLAAHVLCEDYEIVLCHSFTAAVQKLLTGEVDYAVLPVENSLNGGVNECLDLLAEEDVFAIEELPLTVDHRLAMLEGVREEDITCIYSHEQAIRQCSEYIFRRFPNAKCIYTASTVESLDHLDAHSAGIVGAHIVREKVVLSPGNIADNKGNFTRFLLLERRKQPFGYEHGAMVFFCAVCEDRPGALLGLLKIFLRQRLNLTRIESRPVKDRFGTYRFFIEFAGDLASEWVRRAISEAEAYCTQFKLLGAYN